MHVGEGHAAIVVRLGRRVIQQVDLRLRYMEAHIGVAFRYLAMLFTKEHPIGAVLG